MGCKVKKGSRKPKESKQAKDALEKTNGTQEPASDVIKRTNDRTRPLGEG